MIAPFANINILLQSNNQTLRNFPTFRMICHIVRYADVLDYSYA